MPHQVREVYVVTTDPLPNGHLIGRDFYWWDADDQADAVAIFEGFGRLNLEDPTQARRVRLWNAYPDAGTGADGVSDYIERAFIRGEPQCAPIRDTHPQVTPPAPA
jgi:hypothetical protein